jgi:RimJ/RimL family protein N-acetyltransferase
MEEHNTGYNTQIGFIKGAMRLRPATIRDASLLFRWRNDAETLANSFDSKPVRWRDHLRWLSARLRNEKPTYIFEDNDDWPVGTASVDGGFLSYTIAPEHRGKGLSTLMLTWVRGKHGPLICRIKPGNLKSQAAALKAGHEILLLDYGTVETSPATEASSFAPLDTKML